jgi:hypothetical protein
VHNVIGWSPCGRAPPETAQNFALNAVEAQIIDEMSNADGSPSDIGIKLDYIDTAFTVVFTIELLINAYAYWFRCPAPRRVLKARFCPLAIPGDDFPPWCGYAGRTFRTAGTFLTSSSCPSRSWR